MATAATVEVALRATGAARFRTQLRNATSQIRRTEQASVNLRGVWATLATGTLALAMREMVDLFSEQEEAVTSLNAALFATGRGGTAALEKLTTAASELQNVTTQGDEAVIAATASFAQLANALSVDELAQAQRAIIGIADTFMGGDVTNAALILGKTIGGTTNALSRYGIELDATGSQSEKLAAIMEKTNSFFAVSQERALTTKGRLQQLSNAYGDLKESLGGVIVTALGLNDTTGNLTTKVADWTTRITENTGVLAGWASLAVEAFKVVALAIAAPIRMAFNLGEMIGALGTAVVLFANRDFAGASEAFERFRGNLSDLVTPVTDVTEAMLDFGETFRKAAAGIAVEVAGPAGSGAEGGGGGMSGAIQVASASVRDLASAFEYVTPRTRMQLSEVTALAGGTELAATAQERLNRALGQARGLLGGLGGLGGLLGLSIPGLGFGGGLLSTISSFAGVFATGGTIPAGQFGIVGERGPELVTGPARVTPMGGGMSLTVNVPPAADPITMARDQQWARALHESIRNLEAQGFRAAT